MIKTVQAFQEALSRADAPAMIALFDPSVEWYSAENFIYADESPHRGYDGVRRLFQRITEDWDGFSVSADELHGAGDIVICSGRFRGTYKATGAPINAQYVQVFKFKDGKIWKVQVYTDTAQFKDAINRSRLASV